MGRKKEYDTYCSAEQKICERGEIENMSMFKKKMLISALILLIAGAIALLVNQAAIRITIMCIVAGVISAITRKVEV